MSRRLLLSLVFSSFALFPVFADEIKPDDTVSIDIAGESWVVSKTAHVTLDAEAAVSPTTAGGTRAAMIQAVDDAAKADWRMTNFNRAQDQTGLERWSVTFDARLPESELNGLPDAVKKASKAGMQIRMDNVDFSPTLDETEAARAALRAQLMKSAVDQLAALNTAIPGRNYRISQISFDQNALPAFRVARPMMAMASVGNAAASSEPEPEHAQKIMLNAHITFASVAPTTYVSQVTKN